MDNRHKSSREQNVEDEQRKVARIDLESGAEESSNSCVSDFEKEATVAVRQNSVPTRNTGRPSIMDEIPATPKQNSRLPAFSPYAVGVPQYSRSSSRPYSSAKMAATIPDLKTSVPANFNAPSTPLIVKEPYGQPIFNLITSNLNTSNNSISKNLPDSYRSNLPPSTRTLWSPNELDALDRGIESLGKQFTLISRTIVKTKSTHECIQAYYMNKFILRRVRIRKYKKRLAKEDEAYIKYVRGLSKYVLAEAKRMRGEMFSASTESRMVDEDIDSKESTSRVTRARMMRDETTI